MSFKKKVYFCLTCDGFLSSASEGTQHTCSCPRIIKATVTLDMQRTRFRRFIDWLLKDMGYGLAFMGAAIINALLLPHFNLSLKESLLESFCLGFLLIRLLKD